MTREDHTKQGAGDETQYMPVQEPIGVIQRGPVRDAGPAPDAATPPLAGADPAPGPPPDPEESDGDVEAGLA